MRDDDGDDRLLGRDGDRHPRPQADRGPARVPRRGERRARALARLPRDARRRSPSSPRTAIADWCAVHIVEADGSISELAVAHADPAKVTFARELQERYPPDADAPTGVAAVIRSGEPELVPEITDEMLEAAAQRRAAPRPAPRSSGSARTCACRCKGRERVLGAITFISPTPARRFGRGRADLRRGARAARGERDRERAALPGGRGARAGRARARDDRRRRRCSSTAAAASGSGTPPPSGSPASRRATCSTARVGDAVPGWERGRAAAPVARAGEAGRAESVPFEVGDRELWLSISAVGYEDGTVYAFRDLTEERALESMRQDFVATVSHELRTPLAAIYGAALTLRRDDVELEAELHGEAARGDRRGVGPARGDRQRPPAREPARHRQAARERSRAATRARSRSSRSTPRATHLPGERRRSRSTRRTSCRPSPPTPGQLRQVLSNLIENAIKYSPDGGTVRRRARTRATGTCASRSATPASASRASEQRRIFEKFYRLDPDMTRGIGGTGLGLYICRELVRRVDGRIWVESDGRSGSTFHVEIPQERGRAPRPAAAAGTVTAA